MKKNQLKMQGSKIILTAVITCTLMIIIISSCTKSSSSSSSPNYATQFIGTWTTTSNSCGAGNSSFSYSAGSGNNSLVSTGTAGSGSCQKTINLVGTATANGFNFPTQTFTDNCGNSYTISETGTISGGVLTATETVSGTINASCTITATK
jgi:hypothetical protein